LIIRVVKGRIPLTWGCPDLQEIKFPVFQRASFFEMNWGHMQFKSLAG
jgi:hypothetical protein